MKNRKAILLLLLAIALLVVAEVTLRTTGNGATAPLHRRTLVTSRTDPVRVTLRRPDAAATVLVKSTRWQLVSPYSGSVDEQVVLRLVDALAFTPLDDSLSESDLLRRGRTRADFQLDDPSLTVSVGDEEVSFGSRTPSGDGVYVAVKGVDAVFVAPTNLLVAVDVSADQFRRRSLFLSGTGSVPAFDIKRGGGSLLSFRREGELWKVGDDQASAAKVRDFLAAVTAAEAVSFVWPTGATNESTSVTASLLATYGLDPESAVTVTLKGDDGVDRQISLGKAVDDRFAYALAQNGGAIVTVPIALRDAALQDRLMFSDARLFPLEANAVMSFTVGDDETTYAFARDAKGAWRIEAPVDAAADTEAVEALLDRALRLSSADVRSEGLTLVLSTNAAPIIVSRDSVLEGARFEDLRSREMLRIDSAQVRRIVSVPAGAKPTAVVYSRERRSWDVESSEVEGATNADGVNAVLSAISPLVALRVEKLKVSAADLPGYGLDAPYLKIAIDQDHEDAGRRNILIGAETSGGHYATIGSADAVFVISSECVRNLSSALVTASAPVGD